MNVNLQLALAPPEAWIMAWAGPCFSLEKCGLPFLSWEPLWFIFLSQPPLDLRKSRLMSG